MKKYTFIQNWKSPIRFALLLVLFLLHQHNAVFAQCNPDNLAPSILCPASVTVNVAPGICSTSVVLPAPTAVDNCPGGVSITNNAPANNIYPLGLTAVTFTAADLAGNTATCQTTLTVTGGAVYTIVCNDQVMIQANPSGTTTVTPADILEGGPYNCVDTYISLQSGSPAPFINITGTGTFVVECWVAIPSGGYNKCWGNVIIGGGACNPDITPPVAICEQQVTLQSNLNGPNTTILYASQVNNNSYDGCTSNLKLRLTLDTLATMPPTSSTVELVGIGTHKVVLWVGDLSDNWNKCTTEVITSAPQCTPDLTPPTCIAPANITISQPAFQALNLNVTDSLQMIAAFGAVSVWDNCSNGNNLVFSAYSLVVFPTGGIKEITRSFLAIDAAGNTAISVQVITVLPTPATIYLPNWSYPGNTTVDSLTVQSNGIEQLVSSYNDQVFFAECNGEKTRIERTHYIIDFLNPNPSTVAYELPPFDFNDDGQTGDGYTLTFFQDSLWLLQNGQLITAIAPKLPLYTYKQQIRYNYLDTANMSITGTVYLDNNSNCLFDAAESKLANWKVKAIGQQTGTIYTGTTDANGQYELNICPNDNDIEISLDVPFVYNTICPTTYMLSILPNQHITQDIPVELEADCNLLSVDLSTQRIRPCFLGTYNVPYCNLSTQPVSGVYIDVTLDSLLAYNGATIPAVSLGDNRFRFTIGTLAPGACSSFNVGFFANCNAPAGITHCSEARIYPAVLCDSSGLWSGAWIEANGYCDGDSVRLSLTNKGIAPMATELDFIVVEDFIMSVQNPETFQLDPNETLKIAVPANGATWRIQSPQESGHPWGGIVAAFVEGCGGLNTVGASLAFPIANSDPFVATDCMVSVASFDPNDKQAVPTGYGVEHFIEKNTDIQYHLRFQNTGTDTAYTVVLLDSLSLYVDPRSVVPGASSHPFDVDILEGNVLRFRFDNINLPDSTANLEGSQGFVKYNIQQVPNNPEGTVINNQAAIYFDNNAPILTNTTTHTIGKKFIAVETNELQGQASIKVYPNPSSGQVYFELPVTIENGQFELHDALGRLVTTVQFQGNGFRLEGTDLAAGLYFFQINTGGLQGASGKISVK